MYSLLITWIINDLAYPRIYALMRQNKRYSANEATTGRHGLNVKRQKMSVEQNELNQNLIEQSAPASIEQQEKMLSQSEVNKIVGREKLEAEQRARRQLEQEYQQKLMETQQIRQNQSNYVETNSREVDADSIARQVQEKLEQEMQQRAIEQEMHQVANNYLAKMDAAKSSYDDFDEVTNGYNAAAFPQITWLVSGIDNGGDVMYDLLKNPSKLSTIDSLANKDPQLAQRELLRLSQSINENKRAKSEAQQGEINSPLDRLNASRTTGSSGKLSIDDLRSNPLYRF